LNDNNELTVRVEVDAVLPCTVPARAQRGIACRSLCHWSCPEAVAASTVRLEACEQTTTEQSLILRHQHLPVCNTVPSWTENNTVIHDTI